MKTPLRPSRRNFVVSTAALALSGCLRSNPIDAPAADSIVVSKSERRLILSSGSKVLRSYRVDLGFTPQGHKRARGDGRTPEGSYFIDRRNSRSAFHLSLGINYPNQQDIARAAAMGVDPGDDIFIHGASRSPVDRSKPDWTAGCIAVTNSEIEEIWHMVALGTPVTILS